jgi:hypothetical protein
MLPLDRHILGVLQLEDVLHRPLRDLRRRTAGSSAALSVKYGSVVVQYMFSAAARP